MYTSLSPQLAGTLLGLLEVLLMPIPLIFYRYGAKLRASSKVIRQMREDQAEHESKQAKHSARLER
jgi:ABC-type transport system involved in cytochrome bd biosynthesis fused ATPase/permease subunit